MDGDARWCADMPSLTLQTERNTHIELYAITPRYFRMHIPDPP